MNINELVRKAHKNAIDKGFYECESCGGDGQQGLVKPYYNCQSCNGTGISKSKNIPELLMLVVSEVGEACEALRNDKWAHLIPFCNSINSPLSESKNNSMIFENLIKDTFEDEIADCFIRLADLCGYMNIDIEKHIEAKMKYNESRPKKHGKEF